MKKTLFILFIIPFVSNAQPPNVYYNGISGLNGQALYVALYNKINLHTQLTYTPGLWNAYYTTDEKPSGKLWDIYSDIPGGVPSYEYTMGTNQCGNGANHENSCYNREHIWPQSKFSSAYPMESDLWIVYPTDYYVNSKRGDLPYGKVGTTAQYNFSNGTKIGTNVYAGAPSGNCFEPIDSFKGDIARSYFYIVTCYYGDSAVFSDWEMANKIRLKPWAIQMLLEWHHSDPVSAKEIARNEAASALQNNRNPFIDYPIFADCIWAGADCSSLSVASFADLSSRISVYPTPSKDVVHINWQRLASQEVTSITTTNMQGQIVYEKENDFLSEQEINVSNWPMGIYMMQLKTNLAVIIKKIVVE